MAKKTIGFVGKPYTDFLKWLFDNEYVVHCFVERDSNYTFPPQVVAAHQLDFSSKTQFLADLKNCSVPNIDAFVATYENAVVPKAWACEWYGLPGPTEASAVIATDKYLMRHAFQEFCPDVSPDFAQVETWQDIESFMRGHVYPVMLKPANLFKSLLITKNDSLEELRENFEYTSKHLQDIYRKEGVTRSGRLILEEYMQGKCYSVEVFTDQNGNAVSTTQPVDLVMGRDIGIADNYNYSRLLPSQLDQASQAALCSVAKQGVQALGFCSTPAHVELILTPKGPNIIEIGARTGGYRPRMFRLASGVDLFQAQVDVAFGKLPNLSNVTREWCAVYELFSPSEGIFSEIENWDQVSGLASHYYSRLKIQPGIKTGLSKEGYRAIAVIILHHADKSQFVADQTFIEKSLQIIVK